MKKIKVLLYSLFFIFSFSFSYGQTWLWATHLYTRTSDDPRCPVATDKSGNAYVTGSTQTDTLRIGNNKFTGKYSVTYFAKYNATGSVVWAKQLTGNISTSGIATDKSGNFYISGNFGDTVKIGASTLISPFNNGVFLAKFDSNGNALWAKQSQAPSRACFVGIGFVATDESNNVFITGDFEDTVSFGSFTLTMLNNSQGNNRAVFLVKYDSAGNVLWTGQSKTPSVTNLGGSSYSVAADKSGNAYVAGGFRDTFSFGSFSMTGGGIFLVKYSASGSVLWAEQGAGGGGATSVITDGVNPYITGEFQGNMQFGFHTLSSPVAPSIFLTKYDVAGNVIWAQQSSPEYIGNGLAADAYSHIYLTGATYQGQYTNQVSFGKYTLPNPTLKNASFIIELDTTGTAICGSLLNNPGSEATSGIASDPLGNHIYISSIFYDSLFYDGDTVLGAAAGFSSFVARWQSCTLTNGIASISSQNGSILLYPNPGNGKFTIQANSQQSAMADYIEVYNMLGEEVYSNRYQPIANGYQLSLSNQPNGIYLYRVISEQGDLVGEGKLVIEK